MHLLSSFEFLTLGGVFTGVKNNSKNLDNKQVQILDIDASLKVIDFEMFLKYFHIENVSNITQQYFHIF